MSSLMFSGSGERTADKIAAELIDRIKTGDLPTGKPLPTERELCDSYDASRPTVREALSLLQIKGYVSLGGGKRPRAAKPSLDQILLSAAGHVSELLGDAESGAHLEQMRQFIEIGAVRSATSNSSNIQIAKMQQALEANYKAIGTKDFAETDIAFHRSIVSVVGNPVILKLHDLFVSSMLSHRPEQPNKKFRDEQSYEEHRQIYEAVLASNVELASDLVDSHLERSYRQRLSAPQTISIAEEN